MTIAVDFDGTIVENRYPKIGNEIPFATQTLKMLQAEGHMIVLWTVRNGHLLDEAVEWCRQRGLDFYAVNRNFEGEEYEPDSRFSVKVKADVFIDDRNVGGLPDWGTIYTIIREKKSLEDILRDNMNAPKPKVKRRWWPF